MSGNNVIFEVFDFLDFIESLHCLLEILMTKKKNVLNVL